MGKAAIKRTEELCLGESSLFLGYFYPGLGSVGGAGANEHSSCSRLPHLFPAAAPILPGLVAGEARQARAAL